MDTEIEWMEHCVSAKIPFQYAQYFWNTVKQDVHTIVDSDNIVGTMVPALENWNYQVTNKSLMIRGDSGCGKTTWAKIHAPKPALFVRHVDTLKKFRAGYHKSIIFDDCDFNHFPRTGQINLLDYDNVADVHCRHSVAHIPAGTPKIYTCNEWPVNIQDPAIRRRCALFTVQTLNMFNDI